MNSRKPGDNHFPLWLAVSLPSTTSMLSGLDRLYRDASDFHGYGIFNGDTIVSLEIADHRISGLLVRFWPLMYSFSTSTFLNSSASSVETHKAECLWRIFFAPMIAV